MAEHTEGPEPQTPEPQTHHTHQHETRRATGMGIPGRFPDDATREHRHDPDAVYRARHAASDRISETADRVRDLGDRAAERNRLLGRARPLARGAADSMDTAAEYVRTHEMSEMRGDLESQVRRHPLAAITVAFLAGYTLRRVF